jgi:hypothetical protein
VSGGGKAAEDFMHVNLGAARLRILAVLPVYEKDAHDQRITAWRVTRAAWRVACAAWRV